MRLCKVDNLTGTEVLAKDAMTMEYKICFQREHS